MKRYGLFLTTIAAVVLTGLALRGAGWFSHPLHGAWTAGRTVQHRSVDLSTAAAWRYRQCQSWHKSGFHSLLVSRSSRQ